MDGDMTNISPMLDYVLVDKHISVVQAITMLIDNLLKPH